MSYHPQSAVHARMQLHCMRAPALAPTTPTGAHKSYASGQRALANTASGPLVPQTPVAGG